MQVAFLGPAGTYTHQAAYDRFGDSVVYSERETIAGVFDALSPTVRLAVVPQENSIFGNVIETYDQLRKIEMGEGGFVLGEITLGVQHCLLVREGVKLGQIKRILSHEQALGQCRNFIAKYLPSASQVTMASTAAAAQALLSPSNSGESAAICSKLCATVYHGLDVLYEGIQDANDNYTRFYIMGASCDVKLPPSPKGEGRRPRRALVRISRRASLREKGLPSADVLQLLVALNLPATRIDRRPLVHAPPFHDVYFVEVQEEIAEEIALEPNNTWTRIIEQALCRVGGIGGEACLLGRW